MLKIKTFAFVIILLVTIISLLFFNYACIAQKCANLTENLDALEESIINFDKIKINRNLNNVEKYWESEKEMLLAFSNHKFLDDISETFLSIEAKIDTERYAEAIEEIRLAKLCVNCIRTNEIPSFENIF